MTNFKIIAKYVKEIEFKIPNSKTFFMLSKDISKYKINIDISSNRFKEKFIEVETMLSLSNTSDEKDKIKTKIIYSAIVELSENIKDKEELEKIILIKIPTEIYPTLYETFIFLFKQAGIKDLKIEKRVDFEELYNQRKKN